MVNQGAFYSKSGRGPTIGRYSSNSRIGPEQWKVYAKRTRTMTPIGAYPGIVSAPFLPMRGGGIRGRVRVTSSVQATFVGEGVLGACLVNDMRPDLLIAVVSGRTIAPLLVESECAVNIVLRGRASLLMRVRIGATPSAQEIAGAVWSTPSATLMDLGTFGRVLQDAKSQAEIAAIESQS